MVYGGCTTRGGNFYFWNNDGDSICYYKVVINKYAMHSPFLSTHTKKIINFRLCHMAAQFGHMPEILSHVHMNYLTPYPAVLLQVTENRKSFVITP